MAVPHVEVRRQVCVCVCVNVPRPDGAKHKHPEEVCFYSVIVHRRQVLHFTSGPLHPGHFRFLYFLFGNTEIGI